MRGGYAVFAFIINKLLSLSFLGSEVYIPECCLVLVLRKVMEKARKEESQRHVRNTSGTKS